MKSKYKLSIIVPVYNSKSFLTDLLKSIDDNFNNNRVELLMIDDGSTDGSLEIEKGFRSNKRIDSKVIQVPHGGASNARNVGIKYSSGEYILFCDSDDKIIQQIDDIVNDAINKKLDIVSIERAVTFKNNGKIFEGNIVGYKLMQAMFGSPNTSIHSCEYGIGPVCKLFRRQLLIKNDIEFPGGIAWWEDSLFNIQALKYSNKIKLIRRNFYQVRVNKSSVSHKVDKSIINNANNVLRLSNYYLKDVPSTIKYQIYNQERAFILWELFGHFFIYSPEIKLYKQLNDFHSLQGLSKFAPNLQSKLLILSLNSIGFYITVTWYKFAKLLKNSLGELK